MVAELDPLAGLNALYQNAPVGLAVLDSRLRYVSINEHLAELNGLPVDAHLGRSVEEMSPRLAPRMVPVMRRVIETGEPLLNSAISGEAQDRPGVQREWLAHYRPLVNESGKVIGLTVVLEEITDRKRTETIHRQSEEFRLLAEHSTDVIARFDPSLRHLYINPAIENITGLTREAFIGKTNRELGMPEELTEHWGRKLSATFETGNEQCLEFSFTSQEGKCAFEAHLIPEFGDDGAVQTVLAVTRDITARKQAEAALRESEKKYRELVENLQEGIWLVDEHANTVFVNDRLAEMLGYRADEMPGKNLFEFMSGTAAASARENLQQGRSGVKADYELEFQRKDRTPIFTRIATSPLFDKTSHYRGALAAVTDLTERKRAEELLHKREEELRMAQSQGKLGSWTWELATDTITWSEELYRIHGLRPGEPLPGFEGIAEFFTRESAQRLRKAVQQTLQSGEPYEVDVEPLHPDGVRKWSIARGGVVRNESGRIVGLRGTETDITERRQIEEALRESEARFRQVFELVPDVLYRVPLPGHHAQFVSPAIKQLLGFTPEEWQADPEIWMRQLHDEDRERVLDEMESALRGVTDYTQQYRMWHKDGRTLRWFEDRHKIERDHRGKPIALFGAINDITDRKRAEETIRERKQEFRTLAELSPDIVARFDQNLRYIYINPAVERAMNRPRSFFVGKSVGEVGFPEDMAMSLSNQLRSAFRSKRVGAFEFTYPRPDGKKHYFDSRFIPEFDADGRVKTVTMISRDITGLRDSEEQLKRSARELELVNGRLEALARQDELTGLANRRYLFDYMETEWRREARHNHPISLIIADVDHFKLFNDRYGHIAGDSCLRRIAAALRAQVRRPGDLLARYGGEEFVAVLPETTLEGAWKLAETMREEVAELRLEHNASPVAPVVTISLGVASISSRRTLINELINRADEALYAAKRKGRNRVCVAREQ